jgi:endonuclease-3 related protein
VRQGTCPSNGSRRVNATLRIYDALHKAFGPQHWWPGETPFEVIVGAILTQNTAWGNVEQAIDNLKAARLLSIEGLSRAPGQKIAQLVKPSGYFNQKAVKLKAFIDFLHCEFGGSLARMGRVHTPELRQKLLAVHGIGPETADSILLYAFDRPAFVVDAYTIRIFSRHKLIPEKTTYHDTQRFITTHVPKSVRLYNEYHALLVRLGKEFCRKTPKCESCPLQPIPHQ